MSKMKLSDLVAKPFRVKLTHPIIGDTGAWIDITSAQTNGYILKSLEIAKKIDDNSSPQEQIQANSELMAQLVIAWDEDFFEMDCTTENAVKIFNNIENIWIRNAVEKEAMNQANFFTKKKKN